MTAIHSRQNGPWRRTATAGTMGLLPSPNRRGIMAVEERAKLHLAHQLEQTLGDDAAGTLMTLLSDDRLATLATREDLRRLEHATREGLHRLEQHFDERLTTIEQRFDERLTATEQRFGERFATTEERLMSEFRGELLDAVATQTRSLVLAFATAIAALAAVMIGTA